MIPASLAFECATMLLRGSVTTSTRRFGYPLPVVSNHRELTKPALVDEFNSKGNPGALEGTRFEIFTHLGPGRAGLGRIMTQEPTPSRSSAISIAGPGSPSTGDSTTTSVGLALQGVIGGHASGCCQGIAYRFVLGAELWTTCFLSQIQATESCPPDTGWYAKE